MAQAYILRGAGYRVLDPIADPEPGQTWSNKTETVEVLRIDRCGVWVIWTQHPLIDRPMETCSSVEVFKRWVCETGATK
ncbi:hypothetical protein ACELLULO517_07670 [Acidisoma cellulosilytica]|uniref:Uncharacterized protein n=1 Tax=Acidisoma cellulosilyticum TaxID=2802395 RepID=A0A964E386_9PROT|nr:hypothetical protein [Acidisoma cellulosilyticum]MCB8880109.1 hypothetical protein [Acidisoma cellulosilyticum]